MKAKVLVVLVMPNCHCCQRRIITEPCATEIGPQFRCIDPRNCGPTQMQGVKEVVICGPNGIGICCPVISHNSPGRCGIRSPNMQQVNSLRPGTTYMTLGDMLRHIANFQASSQGRFLKLMTQHNTSVGSIIPQAVIPLVNKSPYMRSSKHEVHDEKPQIRIVPSYDSSPRDSQKGQTSESSRRFPGKRSVADSTEIYRNVSKSLDSASSDAPRNNTEAPHELLEDSDYFLSKIEKLIRSIGGMEIICERLPELAAILIVNLRKECPPTVNFNLTRFNDSWVEFPSSAVKTRRRRDAEQLNSNSKATQESSERYLYSLSREYFLKLLEMMMAEASETPPRFGSHPETPVNTPFTTQERQSQAPEKLSTPEGISNFGEELKSPINYSILILPVKPSGSNIPSNSPFNKQELQYLISGKFSRIGGNSTFGEEPNIHEKPPSEPPGIIVPLNLAFSTREHQYLISGKPSSLGGNSTFGEKLKSHENGPNMKPPAESSDRTIPSNSPFSAQEPQYQIPGKLSMLSGNSSFGEGSNIHENGFMIPPAEPSYSFIPLLPPFRKQELQYIIPGNLSKREGNSTFGRAENIYENGSNLKQRAEPSDRIIPHSSGSVRTYTQPNKGKLFENSEEFYPKEMTEIRTKSKDSNEETFSFQDQQGKEFYRKNGHARGDAKLHFPGLKQKDMAETVLLHQNKGEQSMESLKYAFGPVSNPDEGWKSRIPAQIGNETHEIVTAGNQERALLDKINESDFDRIVNALRAKLGIPAMPYSLTKENQTNEESTILNESGKIDLNAANDPAEVSLRLLKEEKSVQNVSTVACDKAKLVEGNKLAEIALNSTKFDDSGNETAPNFRSNTENLESKGIMDIAFKATHFQDNGDKPAINFRSETLQSKSEEMAGNEFKSTYVEKENIPTLDKTDTVEKEKGEAGIETKFKYANGEDRGEEREIKIRGFEAESGNKEIVEIEMDSAASGNKNGGSAVHLRSDTTRTKSEGIGETVFRKSSVENSGEKTKFNTRRSTAELKSEEMIEMSFDPESFENRNEKPGIRLRSDVVELKRGEGLFETVFDSSNLEENTNNTAIHFRDGKAKLDQGGGSVGAAFGSTSFQSDDKRKISLKSGTSQSGSEEIVETELDSGKFKHKGEKTAIKFGGVTGNSEKGEEIVKTAFDSMNFENNGKESSINIRSDSSRLRNGEIMSAEFDPTYFKNENKKFASHFRSDMTGKEEGIAEIQLNYTNLEDRGEERAINLTNGALKLENKEISGTEFDTETFENKSKKFAIQSRSDASDDESERMDETEFDYTYLGDTGKKTTIDLRSDLAKVSSEEIDETLFIYTYLRDAEEKASINLRSNLRSTSQSSSEEIVETELDSGKFTPKVEKTAIQFGGVTENSEKGEKIVKTALGFKNFENNGKETSINIRSGTSRLGSGEIMSAEFDPTYFENANKKVASRFRSDMTGKEEGIAEIQLNYTKLEDRGEERAINLTNGALKLENEEISGSEFDSETFENKSNESEIQSRSDESDVESETAFDYTYLGDTEKKPTIDLRSDLAEVSSEEIDETLFIYTDLGDAEEKASINLRSDTEDIQKEKAIVEIVFNSRNIDEVKNDAVHFKTDTSQLESEEIVKTKTDSEIFEKLLQKDTAELKTDTADEERGEEMGKFVFSYTNLEDKGVTSFINLRSDATELKSRGFEAISFDSENFGARSEKIEVGLTAAAAEFQKDVVIEKAAVNSKTIQDIDDKITTNLENRTSQLKNEEIVRNEFDLTNFRSQKHKTAMNFNSGEISKGSAEIGVNWANLGDGSKEIAINLRGDATVSESEEMVESALSSTNIEINERTTNQSISDSAKFEETEVIIETSLIFNKMKDKVDSTVIHFGDEVESEEAEGVAFNSSEVYEGEEKSQTSLISSKMKDKVDSTMIRFRDEMESEKGEEVAFNSSEVEESEEIIQTSLISSKMKDKVDPIMIRFGDEVESEEGEGVAFNSSEVEESKEIIQTSLISSKMKDKVDPTLIRFGDEVETEEGEGVAFNSSEVEESEEIIQTSLISSKMKDKVDPTMIRFGDEVESEEGEGVAFNSSEVEESEEIIQTSLISSKMKDKVDSTMIRFEDEVESEKDEGIFFNSSDFHDEIRKAINIENYPTETANSEAAFTYANLGDQAINLNEDKFHFEKGDETLKTALNFVGFEYEDKTTATFASKLEKDERILATFFSSKNVDESGDKITTQRSDAVELEKAEGIVKKSFSFMDLEDAAVDITLQTRNNETDLSIEEETEITSLYSVSLEDKAEKIEMIVGADKAEETHVQEIILNKQQKAANLMNKSKGASAYHIYDSSNLGFKKKIEGRGFAYPKFRKFRKTSSEPKSSLNEYKVKMITDTHRGFPSNGKDSKLLINAKQILLNSDAENGFHVTGKPLHHRSGEMKTPQPEYFEFQKEIDIDDKSIHLNHQSKEEMLMVSNRNESATTSEVTIWLESESTPATQNIAEGNPNNPALSGRHSDMLKLEEYLPSHNIFPGSYSVMRGNFNLSANYYDKRSSNASVTEIQSLNVSSSSEKDDLENVSVLTDRSAEEIETVSDFTVSSFNLNMKMRHKLELPYTNGGILLRAVDSSTDNDNESQEDVSAARNETSSAAVQFQLPSKRISADGSMLVNEYPDKSYLSSEIDETIDNSGGYFKFRGRGSGDISIGLDETDDLKSKIGESKELKLEYFPTRNNDSLVSKLTLRKEMSGTDIVSSRGSESANMSFEFLSSEDISEYRQALPLSEEQALLTAINYDFESTATVFLKPSNNNDTLSHASNEANIHVVSYEHEKKRKYDENFAEQLATKEYTTATLKSETSPMLIEDVAILQKGDFHLHGGRNRGKAGMKGDLNIESDAILNIDSKVQKARSGWVPRVGSKLIRLKRDNSALGSFRTSNRIHLNTSESSTRLFAKLKPTIRHHQTAVALTLSKNVSNHLNHTRGAHIRNRATHIRNRGAHIRNKGAHIRNRGAHIINRVAQKHFLRKPAKNYIRDRPKVYRRGQRKAHHYIHGKHHRHPRDAEEPQKTLNLKIVFSKVEIPYQPRQRNPVPEYKFTHEDEFDKIINNGYRKHLFNKGKFSILQLNKNVEVYTPPTEKSSEEDVIGYRKKQSQFVIGGRQVDAPWPWVVGIYELPLMKFVCAGTLFDSQHILSAAHCFSKYKDKFPHFVVVVGSINRWDTKARDQTDIPRSVKKLFLHEGFRPSCYCNDIAVLRLQIPLGPEYMAACIPHYDTAGVGETATVIGWGDTAFQTTSSHIRGVETLQRADGLIIYPKSECHAIMSKLAGRTLPNNFGDYYICAGVPDGSKDACVGDSGGPLLHEDYDGYWSLIGIVSFGYKCGEPGVPGTYTRISYFMPWINKVLQTN